MGMSDVPMHESHRGTCTPALWRPLHAELVVWLPGRPSVRREILDFGNDPAQWILRPDGSGAEASLRSDGRGLLATLRGPERADLEIDFIVPQEGLSLTLWAMAHGPQAEVSVWDHFGRLAVADVLARGTDAEPLRLDAGRYELTGSVQRVSSMLLGLGLGAVQAHDTRSWRAAG
jgi:hypothetical protein